MLTIAPVSELQNYGNVLEKVDIGSPVYLTQDGYGAYSIRDIKDEENKIFDTVYAGSYA